MSIESRMREICTIYNRSDGAVDVFNNPTDKWDAGNDSICIFWPVRQLSKGQGEELENRDTVVSRHNLLLPPSADINALSEVVKDGIRMKVLGKPWHYNNRSGPKVIWAILEEIEG
jgi:hypothetical protein